MSATFWGVPGQANQTLSEVKDVVTWSLACSHSLRAGLTLGKNRGKWALQSQVTPIASPIGPCSCWRCWALVAPIQPLPCLSLGTCPAPLTPGSFVPCCCAAGQTLFPPCSCVTSPRSKCPDCVCPGALHHLIPVPCSWRALPLPGLRAKNSPNTEHGADPGQTVSAILSRWG